MRLGISGVGLVCSVGRTVEASCAALRAGIVRLSPIESAAGFDPSEFDPPIAGAQAAWLTDGFFQISRWVIIGAAALLDMARIGQVDPRDHLFWNRSALLWALPRLDYARFRIDDEHADEILESSCRDLLCRQIGISVRPDSMWMLAHGAAGIGSALATAHEYLDTQRFDRVVLLATDSWIDPMSITSLAEAGRLKTAENPTGLIPGEAGCCILLESEPSVARRGGGFRARISAIKTSRIEIEGGAPPTGADLTRAAPLLARALSKSLRAAVQQSGATIPFDGDLVTDLNGESWRASTWGHSQPLVSDVIDWERTRIIAPASSFGDIGAVSAPAGIATIVQAFDRGHSHGPSSIAIYTSELGETCTIVVDRA